MNKKIYPVIENSDERLTKLWQASAVKKCGDDIFYNLILQMHKELSFIEKQGSSSGYILVKEALNAVRARPYEFYFKGSLTGSLISYLLGFSIYDPLSVVPRVYSEFTYGFDGSRYPEFEMTVTKRLYERLMDYFDIYPGDLPVEYRYDSGGNVTGVYVGEIEKDPEGKWKSKYFHLSFVAVEDYDGFKERILSEDVFDVCHPETISDYVKCVDLAYSTGTWDNNAKELLLSGKASFDELIADREDVFELLLANGIDRKTAYEITEDVRMGRIHRKGWHPEKLAIVSRAGLPEWFVESCEKIEYLWTRPHTIAMLSWLDIDAI